MDGRSRDVLLALIREYVRTAEPVGSRALARRYFPALSPATLRNVMADLEDMGYLAQPHTSAGRVPTDKAYRLYVEAVPPPVPTPIPAEGWPSPATGVEGFMERTSSQLSSATKLTAVLLTPPLKQTTVGRVEIVPLEEDRALAVIVTESGWVTARAITVDPPRTADEIRGIGRELSRRFRGRTVQEIIDMEASPADPLDALHTRGRAVTDQIMAMLQGRTLYVSGAINMLDQPEFWDLATTRELLRLFEQKERLADLMTTFAGGEGLRVTIGQENPVAEMRECTMITSTYLYRNQVLGILGVIGPRRLPYPEVIAIVEETARHVTEGLSRARQELYLPST
jgi:heat-inducible transcriptional repressor